MFSNVAFLIGLKSGFGNLMHGASYVFGGLRLMVYVLRYGGKVILFEIDFVNAFIA
jgi:hypothetical protein